MLKFDLTKPNQLQAMAELIEALQTAGAKFEVEQASQAPLHATIYFLNSKGGRI